MIPQQSTAKIAANRVRKLIEDAPAGGIFHDVTQSDIRELHKGAANETAYFVISLTDGHAYEVAVKRLA
jgi:hypothetical protein